MKKVMRLGVGELERMKDGDGAVMGEPKHKGDNKAEIRRRR